MTSSETGRTVRRVQVLRFFAGGLPLAAATSEVLGFEPEQPGPPHVAHLLGLSEVGACLGRRTLRLRAAGLEARVVVDGPVQIQPLWAEDILPAPRALGGGRLLRPLIGFARDERGVFLLIDVPSLAALALNEGVKKEGIS